MKSSAWLGCLLVALSSPAAFAQERDAVLFLDAEDESSPCVVKTSLLIPGGGPLPRCSDPHLRPLFLVQGKRAEMRVYNRKFLTDYSITIDAVTPLTGAPIRGLPEAENLTIGAPTFAVPPPSKGGPAAITERSAGDILQLLLDENRATKPLADLNADYNELNREQADIDEKLEALNRYYQILRGGSTAPLDCKKISGAPDAQSLIGCLERELNRETLDPAWQDPGPYSDEQGFREVIVRVQDLVLAVKAFSGLIANSNIVQSAQQLDDQVTQYEKSIITLERNVESALDAAHLLVGMVHARSKESGPPTNLRNELRHAQLKASLIKSLKPPLDDAEIEKLLRKYDKFMEGEGEQITLDRGNKLEARAREIRRALRDLREPRALRERMNLAKSKVGVALPQVLDEINAEQGRLLARVNEIHDHSEVPEALAKQIDLSGHSGNLIVYYTIRRIETFTRFVVAPVQSPGVATTAVAQGIPLPPPAGTTAPSPGAPPASAGAAASTNPAPAPGGAPPGQSTGTVVAHGIFYVHDLNRANVVAAFAYSWAKDQSIVKHPQPTACGGSTAAPDTNCFSPLLNNSSSQLNLILGINHYIHPRDTFYDLAGPRLAGIPERSRRERLWQSTGVLGAISATKANDWFLGWFIEPVLGVQVGLGANFTSEQRLQKNYQFGTPVNITGDFPTQEARVTKPFISAGLDLGLFRRIFGKLTGIGSTAAATQGE